MRRSLWFAAMGLMLLPASVANAGVAAHVDAGWRAFAGGGISRSGTTVVVEAVGEPAIGVATGHSAVVEAGVLALPLGDVQSPANGQWIYLPEVAKR